MLDSGSAACPRLCVLKREQGESYGFFLRVERGRPGHIIRNVAPGGIAERSGLRDGDRLLEVNCCFVDDSSHQEVRNPLYKISFASEYQIIKIMFIDLNRCLQK